MLACACRTQPEHEGSSSADRAEEEGTLGGEGGGNPLEKHPWSCSEASTSSARTADRGRSWWQTDDSLDQSGRSVGRSHSHTDWSPSLALFPDLGSTERLSSELLPPDPSLLPGGVVVGTCNITRWRNKINLREVKMSAKEQRREEDRSRRRWDVNRDRQVYTAACHST